MQTKVEIKRLDDDLAPGTKITVYGVTTTKVADGDWRADPLEKASAQEPREEPMTDERAKPELKVAKEVY